MGLPLALKAHSEGNLNLAKEQYIRALEHDDTNSIIYQNYGALLKSLGNYDEAENIYIRGLKLFPTDLGIMTNYANVLRKTKPVSALEQYSKIIKLRLEEGESISSDNIATLLIDVIGITRQLDLTQLSLQLIARALLVHPHNPFILVNLMLLLDSDNALLRYSNIAKQLTAQLEAYLDVVSSYCRLEILFGLATHQLSDDKVEKAKHYYDLALKCTQEIVSLDPNSDDAQQATSLLTINSWNISCTILRLQDFERGWPLFEYGLQTPCKGKQRWQRALPKPFSSEEVMLWRGESLSNKRLLLLEEQAIGDIIQFSTLLQTIIEEAQSTSLFLSDRLISIFNRAYANEIQNGKLFIYTRNDFNTGKFSQSLFDYQSPIGSICQYRFLSPSLYSPRVPCLISDVSEAQILKAKYLPDANQSKIKLIGISWQGGGKGDRIRQKSILPSEFFDLLYPIKGVRFVSLQYGNFEKQILNWRSKGLDVIYDSSVDSLKDMDRWLSQVSACDAVLSIANTTIHGAGGLNIPTLCLLSRYADWRWLSNEDVTRSYWYPSVGIARESSTNGWQSAFLQATNWMSSGCPYPSGPSHIQQ